MFSNLKNNKNSNNSEHNDLYKHLANVYISKGSKRNKDSKIKLNPVFSLLSVNTIIISLLLFVFVLDRINQPNPFKVTSRVLNINDNDHPLEIKYSLCSPKSLNNQMNLYFNNIDLTSYKNLRLFVKSDNKSTKRIILFLRNKSGSKAVSVIDNITDQWKVFIVPLKSFEGVKDFSNINRLSFGVENWNLNNKRGQIFIGDITFLR